LYQDNLRYSKDPDLIGDVNVVATGASSLVIKEAEAVRRNEFLQVTANPFDMQITGLKGRSEVLRSVAQGLELNTDKIVPPEEDIMAQAQQAAAQQQVAQGTQGQPKVGSNETLSNGAAVTDNFSPNSLTP